MAADSFHHKVELAMKKMGNKLYDFPDFVKSVKATSNKTDVLPMELNNFSKWKDYSSQFKLKGMIPRPYIQGMVMVQFKRGSLNMQYKTDFANDFIEINFLKAEVSKAGIIINPPEKYRRPLGISKEKKEKIIKTLGGLMKNRLKFWEDLALNE